MAKKRYILLKETVECEKGAILEEKCDDGEQDFQCIDNKYVKIYNDYLPTYDRKIVMEQPDWFQEVITIGIPKGQLTKAKKLLKKNKII